jgi:hypothetical protein
MDIQIALEWQIMELIKNDNGNTVHFDWSHVDDNLVLTTRTYNQIHKTSFIMCKKSIPIYSHITKSKLLEQTLEYLKTNIPLKSANTYTVHWAKKTNDPTKEDYNATPIIHTSYFYGVDILDVCNKFYDGKHSWDFVVYDIKLNPLE